MHTLYWTTALVLTSALANLGTEAKSGPVDDESDRWRTSAIQIIERALQEEPTNSETPKYFEYWRRAAEEVQELTKQNVLIQEKFAGVLQMEQPQDPLDSAKRIQAVLAQARDILAFQPTMEAALPEGFPQQTPVGEIRVQRYPSYRLARTKMSGSENSAFWTLFTHIQSNKIAMTAPVEMSYEQTGSSAPRTTAMAFLYANEKLGQSGSAGDVTVMDVPAMTTVSIGVQGEMNPDAVAAAHSRLKAWLADHAHEYEAAGELRVLGYNSPMIATDKKYFEVQVPVCSTQEAPP